MMKILQKIITLLSALTVLNLSSCDSGGGSSDLEMEPVAAPENITGRTLTLILDEGPLEPPCFLKERVFDFRSDEVLDEDGKAYAISNLEYKHEATLGRVSIDFAFPRSLLIRLIFNTPTSGSFSIIKTSMGAECTTHGSFTLTKNSPGVGIGIEAAP